MLRVCTSSIIVKLSIGGVSLILTDARFGSFSQNLVTNYVLPNMCNWKDQVTYTFIEFCVGEIKGKVYFKCHKVQFWANSVLLLQ